MSLAPLTFPALTLAATDSNFLLWALVLIGLGILLFVLEVFVPSAGMIGLMAGTSLVAGIVLLYRVDRNWGLIATVVTLLAAPVFLLLALKLWPSTPLARLLTLTGAPAGGTPGSPGGLDDPAHLINATGRALTDMRPVGTCLIQDQRLECLSEVGMISAGTLVKVVTADGMQIKVRPLEKAT